ncbi:hypothetical protein CP556_08815 [Natrinema sp. CBA1119]|uniref:hypothetical protein n=1 Tax=Natrinema sp. CBA1119 TaxID=1608465 RepID=UPI000BFA2D78|nr:hypothetical protein [Natrinema sp. CBA1119]PGF16203.1 hypothetical protein CP556_08815 [Natrinema sp. CBA1119]
MTCPYCETANHPVAECPERHEERDGLPSEQNPDHWILEDGLWHASMALEDGIHTCICGTSLRTPVERVADDLRYIPAEYDAPVCRDCVATIEGQRAETVPADATFERASELRADGGALTEGELIDRAVREAADLVGAGDSNDVAVGYVVDEHELEHRRDDVRKRLEERLELEVVTDGGIDVDFDAIREEVSFFLRRANSGGAKAALHLPAEGATREDPAVRCKYNNREGVAFRPQELDATPDWQLIKRGCSECFGTASRPTNEQCGRKPSDVLEEAGFDVVTDGGRDLQGRQAFLAGDAHWCDICSNPFDSLAELIHHDCNDGSEQTAVADGGHEPGSIETRLSEIDKQAGVILEDLDDEELESTTRRLVEDYLGMIKFHTETIEFLLEHGAPPYDNDDDDGGTPIAVTDGGQSEHRARCEDCAWSYSDSDLVDVSDEMDRHVRKEMHDVDLERAVATDGGQEAAAYMNEEVELRIRGDRVHVQTLLAILSVTSSQMSGGKLNQAGELAKSVPDQVLTLEDARDAAHSMIASGGEGWAEDDPAEVLDVEYRSVVDDRGVSDSENSTGTRGDNR